MRLAQAVRVGSWVMIGLNLLMATATIAIFTRMAPAITVIIDRNDRTLQACEDMLAILAMVDAQGQLTRPDQQTFRAALQRAKENITEAQEPEALARIETRLSLLFAGDANARRQTVEAILRLAQINRDAMTLADRHAHHLGRNGAWGVVFMALATFLAGLIFLRSLTRRVITPLEEIHTVMNAQRNGDTMRRCTGVELAQDVAAVFTGINEMLDRQHTSTLLDDEISRQGLAQPIPSPLTKLPTR